MDHAIESDQHQISISSLRLALERKSEELKQVQTAFEEYTESSHELEQELEQELTRTEARNTHLSKRVQTYEHEIQLLRDRLTQLSHEFRFSEEQNASLLSNVKELERGRIQLEQQLDESLTEIRILRATEADLKHQFEREMEERIFLTSENEELKRQQQLKEERFRTHINDLKLELDLQQQNYEKVSTDTAPKEYQSVSESLQNDLKILTAELQEERKLRQCLEEEVRQQNAQGTRTETMESEFIELTDELTGKTKDASERDFRIQTLGEQILMQIEEILILKKHIASWKIDLQPSNKPRSRSDSIEVPESSCSTISTSKSHTCDPDTCKASDASTDHITSKYHQERTRNAVLLSRLQTVTGNIQVVCRVRPDLTKSQHLSVRIVSTSDVAARNVLAGNVSEEIACNASWKIFTFDRVFGPTETQNDIFSQVEPIAQSVIDGYKACVFAYGQTGSGKTYTMQGTDQNPGVNHRILEFILTASCVQSDAYRVQLGALEIYNDTLRDLSTETCSQSLKLCQNEDKQVVVAGLRMQTVFSVSQALLALSTYHQNRICGETKVHSESSRSHLIVILQLVSTTSDDRPCGKLYLVDLAGSERVKTSRVQGVMLKEAAHINRSLSALADVMEALDKKAAFVPYRNSKLTFLLQDALHASCKTLMIVNIAPGIDTANETYRSLQLATRARNIEIGRDAIAKNNDASMKQAWIQIQTLRQEVALVNRKWKLAESLSKEVESARDTSQRIPKTKPKQMSLKMQLNAIKKVNEKLEKDVNVLRQCQTQSENARQTLERRARELSAKWNAERKLRQSLEHAIKRLEMDTQTLPKRLPSHNGNVSRARKPKAKAEEPATRSWK